MFDEIKKRLGFGCMRLPMKGMKVDEEEFCKMIDEFIGSGFNYFDTSRVYIAGQSEKAIKKCLSARYPRDKFVLTDKLTSSTFFFRHQIKPMVKKELASCGVDYFDFLLMHAQNAQNYAKYTRLKAYETAYELKKEGLIRHLGISFHDKAEVLEKILVEHPEVEVVQLQLNYLDFDDPKIDGRRCYEVCKKYNKPILVMEPVKGGVLARLPEEGMSVVRKMGGVTPANLAIRYVSELDNVACVLSGMSNLAQMKDNISFMKEEKALSKEEKGVIQEIKSILAGKNLIKCTSCRYCVDGCPKQIPIPELFSLVNKKRAFKDKNAEKEYNELVTKRTSPTVCIGCGKCEQVCPQHLPIRVELKKISLEIKK